MASNHFPVIKQQRSGWRLWVSWLIRCLWPLSAYPNRPTWMAMMASDKPLSGDAMKMIDGVLEVSGMQARDIMLPRPQMVMIDDDMPLEAIQQVVIESGHSRFPVMGDNRDTIQGILLAKDLLKAAVLHPHETFDLKKLLRPAFYVTESKGLNELLQEFRSHHNHLAVVVDEYGGVAGMVTIEDILEQIVGEIEDEYDDECDEWIKSTGKYKWVVNGLTSIEAFNEHFGTDLSDDQFDTMGGLVTHRLGRVAKKGEKVRLDAFECTVLHTNQKNIKLMRVRQLDARRS